MSRPISKMTRKELLQALKGSTVSMHFMFHSYVFIDGIFSHAVIALEKKYPDDLRKLHGALWEPPELTIAEMREALRQ